MSEAPQFAGMSGRLLSRTVTATATMGFLLFGYDQGVMSSIIDADAFTDVLPELKDNSTMQGTVTALYEVGCLFGALFMLIWGDWLGRRKGIITGAIIMILGVVIQVTSYVGHQPLAQFIIGRIITGAGNGMNTSTIPTYQAECSRTSNRGLLICIEGGTIAFGTLIAYWIDFGASYGSPDLVWRFPIAFQCLFGIFIIIGMSILPESPRWLFTRERYEEGERVIAALMGEPINSPEVILQKNIIMDSIRASGQIGKTTPMSAVFTGGKTQHFRRMLLGASSQFMQQIGGCNAVIYYLPILFKNSLKMEGKMPSILGGVNMVVYAIFATGSWFLIERVGRRKLFLYGTVGQMLSMVLTFACLIPGQPGPAKGAAVGLFTYIASFGATWLPLPWLYPAEISPIKTRAKANALSTCSNWLFNFLIVMVTPIMISRISWGTYLFFAAINACFLPVIYFFYPETARRSLEEIDLIFAKGYLENLSYVKAAQELPYLTDEDVERVAIQYGFGTMDEKVDFKANHMNQGTPGNYSSQDEKVKYTQTQ
ncbi:Major facilitator superfamily domain general substrate transporter [Penicillium macrosclerotiorum]|uniref:Major facilitator superfamily domain general substrate transporter n=1 Tax=Penicillium macrosclerotiorum TaxID=303699 RepID=UPI00254954E9|nr:Major facilitator superfamily domain general substrate transporter [Penicillium macrosclerotiorum]KAJ5698248.1 Major facilitator superfamily domain general substrate transporter [Penicillium macrosclerotiorum]